MSNSALHRADQAAFEQFCQSVPAWTGMGTAADAIGLTRETLLHAGPPFPSIDLITQPILNSACVAAVYESLANDFDQARAMVQSGEILLKPAQDYGIVTPLAAVVSSTMPLHEITDLNQSQTRVYTPINGGSKPAMRLGLRSKAVLDHIRWLNGPFAESLTTALTEPMELIPLALAALRAGDDCHGYTPEGGRLMMAEVERNIPGGIQDETMRDFIATSPSLFLNVWMAASKCMMTRASNIASSSFVTAIGGNGLNTGIQISGLPGRWFQTPATPPVGRFDIDLPLDRALPAIGDSAVVEGLGLGAMAIQYSPVQQNNLGEFLPADYDELSHQLMAGSHPEFKGMNCPLGLVARAAADLSLGPVIGLGILDKLGEKGRLGGGIYQVLPFVFREAVDAMTN